MSDNQNNPLKTIVDFYKEQVEEANTKGYSDFYKRFTEFYLFDFVPSELKEVELTFTPVDIEYGDGYFIFGRGSNSVVSFRVAEAPGWLFGIWYRIEESVKGDKTVYSFHYEVFAQYEQFIDKFKPSYSALELHDFIYDVTPDYTFSHFSVRYNAANMFIFIIKEPALAFCRDQFNWDYNEEYHTREEAEERMQKMLQREQLQIDFKKIADGQLLDYIKQFGRNTNRKGFIHDFGENISPRYEVSFLYPEDCFPRDWEIGERVYSCNYRWLLKEDNELPLVVDEEELRQFSVGFDELREKLELQAEALDIYYSSAVSYWFHFESVEYHNEYKQRLKDETGENIEDSLIYF